MNRARAGHSVESAQYPESWLFGLVIVVMLAASVLNTALRMSARPLRAPQERLFPQ
jgi:hypothetical protein